MSEGELVPIDAYRYPQQVRPGCTHQLGCRCTPPYWLRPSTPDEQAHERRIVGVLANVQSC